jgi:hypothetical protein
MKIERRIPVYILVIYLILILSGILSLFLPYRIIIQEVYFGPTLKPSFSQIFNGFQFKLTYGAIVLMIITSVLVVFSRRKVGMILSLIFLGFYMLYVLFLYAALNFILSLRSPPSKADAGLGYYLLLGISIIFILLTIITYKKRKAIVTRKLPQQDLLDDF